MHFCNRHLWDDAAGSFRDRVHMGEDIGLLREPSYPFAPNCNAAASCSVLPTSPAAALPRPCPRNARRTDCRRPVATAPDGALYALALQDLAAARNPDPPC